MDYKFFNSDPTQPIFYGLGWAKTRELVGWPNLVSTPKKHGGVPPKNKDDNPFNNIHPEKDL